MQKKKYLQLKRKAEKKAKFAGILLFFVLLFAGLVLGLLLFLRPTVSEREKRNLTEFPAFSLSAVLDGSYFSSISTWYSDSYPLRDLWLDGNSVLENLHGIQTVQIVDNGQKSDKLPEVVKPSETAAASSEAVSKEENAGSVPETAESKMPETDQEETAVQPETTQAEAAQTVSEAAASTASSEAAASTASSEAAASTVSSEAAASSADSAQASASLDVQVLGGVIAIGDAAYEMVYFNQTSATLYIDALNTLAASLQGTATVYDVLVTSSAAYYIDEATHENMDAVNQNDETNYYYASMSSLIKTVPIYETLAEHATEYIYFRTDHHWTALGAYYAYVQWAKAKGIEPNPLEAHQTMTFDGFLGSFYSSTQSAAMAANPDTVIAYLPLTCNDMVFTTKEGEETAWRVVNDVSTYKAGGKYSAFAGGDHPISVCNNPQVTNGQTCLIIKESYGNAFVPFVVDHYQTTYWLDYRHYDGSIRQFILDHNVNDVIFVNGLDVISDIDYMQKFSAMMQ